MDPRHRCMYDDVIKCKHFPRYSDRWIPLTKASDTEIWYFLCSAPEQTAEQIIETLVIWDARALVMTPL